MWPIFLTGMRLVVSRGSRLHWPSVIFAGGFGGELDGPLGTKMATAGDFFATIIITSEPRRRKLCRFCTQKTHFLKGIPTSNPLNLPLTRR